MYAFIQTSLYNSFVHHIFIRILKITNNKTMLSNK